MKYPGINKQPRREVNLPELSGGINLRDSVSMIRDNQLTDSCNMWFKDGMLKTRPSTKNITSYEIQRGADKTFADVRFHPEIKKGDAFLSSYTFYSESTQYVFFWWQKGDEKTELPTLQITDFNSSYEKIHKYFVAQHKGDVYVYFDNFLIYKLADGTNEWKQVTDEEITAPVVMTHCKPTNHSYSFTGTQINGYNLIGRYYKMIYSAVNFEDDEHHMWYQLKWNLPSDFKGYVTAKLTHKNGAVVEHKVYWEGDPNHVNPTYYEEKIPGKPTDGYYMFVGPGYIAFSLEERKNSWVQLSAEAAEELRIEDNLEITTFYNAWDSDKKKIFNMTQQEWFGGAAAGISGGTRLFLCGNSNDSEKALVAWSALNDPLYFPENNYFYVGNEQEPVTAFGRQGENLIIFKPNETYYTYYSQNTSITAEHLINQSVIDYQANSVYFPLVTLNSKIGCAFPDTVKLCRNRLVWFNTDGRVYTLTSANQYSEMTVYPVSEMIERRLLETIATEDYNGISAVDFNGHYALFIGNKAFVMDYNCYGFSNVYSYSKTEDANALIPWYYWEFEIETAGNSLKFYECENKIYCGFRIELSYTQDAICTIVIDAENRETVDEYYFSENGETTGIQAKKRKNPLS